MISSLVSHGMKDALEGVLSVHSDGHGDPGTRGLHARQKLVPIEIFNLTKHIADSLKNVSHWLIRVPFSHSYTDYTFINIMIMSYLEGKN